jgi:glucosamine--fructose-6-phosphate aminotransferase (isomerizing)
MRRLKFFHAKQLKDLANDTTEIPSVIDCLSPILTVIPLQLLACHLSLSNSAAMSINLANLAKSVTVE